MEYRDLYDKDRNLTGKTIAKGEEIPNGYYIRVVVCFMENSEGKFLMQKNNLLLTLLCYLTCHILIKGLML